MCVTPPLSHFLLPLISWPLPSPPIPLTVTSHVKRHFKRVHKVGMGSLCIARSNERRQFDPKKRARICEDTLRMIHAHVAANTWDQLEWIAEVEKELRNE